jgi:hypothetical protein
MRPNETFRITEKPQISAASPEEMSPLGYTTYTQYPDAEGALVQHAIEEFRRQIAGPTSRRLAGVYPDEHAHWKQIKRRVKKSPRRNKMAFKDFKDFLYHIGQKPGPPNTVDRINPLNFTYGPGNVRWATRRQQQNNRRNTNKLGGIPLTEQADATGVKPGTLRKRLNRELKRPTQLRRSDESLLAQGRLPRRRTLPVILPAQGHAGGIQGGETIAPIVCSGHPAQDAASGLHSAVITQAPASPKVTIASIWKRAWSENLEGVPVSPLGATEYVQLARARSSYAATGNKDWLDFLDWTIRNWRETVMARFGWWTKARAPTQPDAGFLTRKLGDFVGCYAARVERERLDSLTGDKAVYERARALGKSHLEAAQLAAKSQGRQEARQEADAELKRLRQAIQAHQGNLRQRELERTHMERARQRSVPTIQPRPFKKAERSTEEVLAMMQATLDPAHRADTTAEQVEVRSSVSAIQPRRPRWLTPDSMDDAAFLQMMQGADTAAEEAQDPAVMPKLAMSGEEAARPACDTWRT